MPVSGWDAYPARMPERRPFFYEHIKPLGDGQPSPPPPPSTGEVIATWALPFASAAGGYAVGALDPHALVLLNWLAFLLVGIGLLSWHSWSHRIAYAKRMRWRAFGIPVLGAVFAFVGGVSLRSLDTIAKSYPTRQERRAERESIATFLDEGYALQDSSQSHWTDQDTVALKKILNWRGRAAAWIGRTRGRPDSLSFIAVGRRDLMMPEGTGDQKAEYVKAHAEWLSNLDDQLRAGRDP